jgi:transposase
MLSPDQRTHIPAATMLKRRDTMSHEKNDFAALIGIDWADREHAICIKDTKTGRVESQKISHSPNAIETWAQQLCQRFAGRQIAVALELSKGPLFYALLKYDFFVLFPIAPQSLAKYRDAFTPSGAKDDPTDANLIMDLLEKHRDRLTAWQPQSPKIRALQQYVEMRRTLVNDTVRITNRITAALKNYYPQVLDWFPEKNTTIFCDFLTQWPNIKAVKRARQDTLQCFFHDHKSYTKTRNQDRIEQIKGAIPLTEDEGIIKPNQLLVTNLVAQLRGVLLSIDQFDQVIDEIYQNHPDAPIFKSLPGAAKVLAPRLMTVFGEDRDRYQSADDITKYGGIAPVTERSGDSEWIHWRWSCPTFLRQSLVEWANQSIKFSFWAQAYYQMQRDRGKSHQVAIRALTYKWIRIIFRCWQNKTPYNESRYLMVLQKKGSPLLKNIANTELNS